MALISPAVEIPMELLLALPAIVRIVTVESLHLPVSPAAVMVIGVAAEAAASFRMAATSPEPVLLAA
jgi:hypothetical protein